MSRRSAASASGSAPSSASFCHIAEASGPLSATELLNAWAELDLLRAKTLEEMRDYPVLLCPVASIPAFRPGERPGRSTARRLPILMPCATRSGSTCWPHRRRWCPWAARRKGLPIGVQIVARPFEDEIALGIAAIVDAAFGYQPPPMALLIASSMQRSRRSAASIRDPS